ncbi:type II toxin-antitoxin system Phd/YefM family antitoxin [Olsenella uli]|uniref:type II toxin-antitoxin system Phd/YefM family antitoxin n=1 Tax=Olsenella uli TaxID=133926 RepID=UPI0024A9CCEB|nr:type II toxin-antitoxin system Phd/YefM family antitoxin [Olsenella uli]
MPTAVPIRDLKNTAAFARLVDESPEPITVTKNGYDKFVATCSQDYMSLQEEVAEARLVRIVTEGDRSYGAGDYADGGQFLSDLRERYGL